MTDKTRVPQTSSTPEKKKIEKPFFTKQGQYGIEYWMKDEDGEWLLWPTLVELCTLKMMSDIIDRLNSL